MRTGLKKWSIAATAALMAAGMCIPAFAATKISNVKITLSGDEPQAGGAMGSAEVKIPDAAYYTVDDSFYTNEGDDEWERGATPVYRVELEAKDGYYFSSMSKSNISISGMHGTYKTSKVLDGGSGIRIDIKLRKVSGDLSDIDDFYWDGRIAKWDEVDDADKYEVKLYRGTRTVTTVTTSNNQYNFYPYMTSSGDYSFKVRAVSNSDGEKSSWTDQSEEYYMNSSNVYTGAAPGTGGTTGTIGGGWLQNQYGWYYTLSNNTIVKSNWLFVDNNWFYFDANGYMMTGLQAIDGRIFYLNPVSDGTRGAMLTGVQIVNGLFYYFNPISDGTRGAMLTGFQTINNNVYYFDTNSGSLWANTVAPNGKWIDAAGVIR